MRYLPRDGAVEREALAKSMMRRLWRDGVCVGLLLLLPLLLFAPVSLGGRTLLPVDVLYLFEPYREMAARAGVGSVHNGLVADLILENYVWKQFLVDALESRTLPLWNPYLFSGQPFLANGQHSALYPLTWLFLVVPIARAFGLFTVLQLGLTAVWMYVYGRVLRIGRVGALVGGIVFGLSGFMTISVVHPMIIAGASWLPLLLALIECAVSRRRFWRQAGAVLPWVLLGGIALGLQILAGHAEPTYFVLLVMGAYGVWRLAYLWLKAPRPERLRRVLMPAAGLALMVGLGLALGAAQLVPLYETARTSFRQGAVTLAEVLNWAYPKRRLITFFIPNFFGNPTHRTLVDVFSGQLVRATVNARGEPISAFDWGMKNYVEGAAYLGILPLLLATYAILRAPPASDSEPSPDRLRLGRLWGYIRRWGRQPYVPFFTTLAIFSLGCVFGTPLYALIYALPFLDQSHSPFRWVFPLTLAVAALAGIGADGVAGDLRGRRSADDHDQAPARRRWHRSRVARILCFGAPAGLAHVLGALAIWGGGLVIAGVIATRLAYGQLAVFVERAFTSLALASAAFPDARAFYSYLVPWTLLFGVNLLLAGLGLRIAHWVVRLPGKLGGARLWNGLAVILVVADLVLFATGFSPAVDPALLAYQPAVVDFLKAIPGTWRLAVFDPHGHNTFNMNTPMFYGLQDVRGYDSLFSAQYARYMGWIEPQELLLYNRIGSFRQFSSLDSPLTDMLNVEYVVSEVEIPLPKYRLVYQDEAVFVYENLGAMPRAFSLPLTTTLTVADLSGVGEAVLNYDPRYYTIVEAAPEGWLDPASGSKPGAAESMVAYAYRAAEPGSPRMQTLLAYGTNEVLVEATVEEPSWLVLTDTFAPGWKAFIRPLGADEGQEREVAIARVTGNFRGVQLDESAVVRFKYSPNSVKVGFFASFLGGMVVVFLAVVWVWRLVHRESSEQTAVQRLAKNSIAPIALNLFNRAVEFAFAALMLRILGPGNAGDYVYAVSIFVWFDILTNFGLNTYLTREVARHRHAAQRYLLNTTAIRLGLAVVGVPLMLGFIGIRQTLIADLASPASSQVIVAILLLYAGLVPNSISTGLTALFYAYEKAEIPAAIQSVTTLVRVTVQTIVLVAGWGIIGLAGSSIAINFVTLTILAVLAWRLLTSARREPAATEADKASPATPVWQDSAKLRREMMRESSPLMVNHLLAILFYKVDEFLMEPILGSVSLGLYSIGYKLLDALIVFPSLFTAALFPVISRQAQDDREAMKRFYQLGAKILILIALLAALVATVMAPDMVLILGGPEYLPGAMIALRLMVWSMPIGWINGITQYVLIALDQQRYLTRAYLVGFGFSLLGNLLLMPRFGYPASAILHVASELVLFIPFMIGVRRHLGPIGWRDILFKPLAAAALSAILAVLVQPAGRGVALLVVCVAYPLLVWRLGVLAQQERELLASIVRRPQRASPDQTQA